MTEDFHPGKSDLDLAIYTRGGMITLDVIVQDFLSDKEIKVDLICLSPEFTNNFIDIAPLESEGLTGYYPIELIYHFEKLIFALQRVKEDRMRNYALIENAIKRSV